MKELIEVIAKSLVDHPSEVVVTETVSGDDLLLELKVDPSDMGKVIGRQGRIAKAIRTVVKAASSKIGKGTDSCCRFLSLRGQRDKVRACTGPWRLPR